MPRSSDQAGEESFGAVSMGALSHDAIDIRPRSPIGVYADEWLQKKQPSGKFVPRTPARDKTDVQPILKNANSEHTLPSLANHVSTGIMVTYYY